MNSFEQSESEAVLSFEEQFKNQESFELFGGVVKYVDVKPEKEKTEVPVIFALGWGETPETFKDAIRLMSERGRRVISISHARGGGKVDKGDVKEEYPEEELRKAFAILKILEEKGIEKADVVAHSEGGINTAIAATIETEKFRNIIFVNVGGLIGPDKFPKLAGRFSMNFIQEALLLGKEPNPDREVHIGKTLLETTKYILKNPLRALRESVAISESEINGMLENLHDSGVGVVVVNGVDDPVFPMEKMQEVVKREQVDGFLSVEGGHNEIFANPEKFIPAIDNLLDTVEKKKQGSV